MKRIILLAVIGFSALTLLNGCLDLQLGGGTSTHSQNPTLGQQLVDLKKAKDTGAISDTEYEAQKAKLLAH
jgi:hypothetical protein